VFILYRFLIIETIAEQKSVYSFRDNYAINHKRDTNIIREDGYFAFPSLIFII